MTSDPEKEEPPRLRPVLLDNQPLGSCVQWYMPPRRPYSRRELLADQTVHVLSCLLSWVLTALICYKTFLLGDEPLKHLCLITHGVGFIVMCHCSLYYHFNAWNWPILDRLLSIDNIGISSMIMGSYAPFTYAAHEPVVFAITWTLGGLGLLGEFRRLIHPVKSDADRLKGWTCEEKLHLIRYMLMGWAFLLFLNKFGKITWNPYMFLVGSIVITVGVVFLICNQWEFHMAAWHICVTLGCLGIYLNILSITGHLQHMQT